MKTTFHVPGMKCAHCEKSIKEAVGALQGVEAVAVDLAEKSVVVDYSDAVTQAAIKDAIEDIGFDVA